MSRLTAIAAIALCWIVASFAYEHAPILAQGRSILDLSEPDSLPSEDEAEPFEVELRFKLNAMSDSFCFLQGLAEFHQWRSDRMGPTDGDTLGLQGASLNLGVLR